MALTAKLIPVPQPCQVSGGRSVLIPAQTSKQGVTTDRNCQYSLEFPGFAQVNRDDWRKYGTDTGNCAGQARKFVTIRRKYETNTDKYA